MNLKDARDPALHAPVKVCFLRRYHARLRRIDEEILLPAIRRAASKGKLSERTADAWALFQSMPGQEHWRCGCAQADRAQKEQHEATR